MFNNVLRILILQIALLMIFCSHLFASTITIKPGNFSHFSVNTPDKIVAGKKATITITAVDSLNNVISNFADLNREFQATVSGSASITPETFKASAFKNGVFELTLTDNVAETITLTIKDTSKPLPLLMKDLKVSPANTKLFSLTTSKTVVTAGEPIDITITAKDAYGNITEDAINLSNISITFRGDADPKITYQSASQSGKAILSVASQKAGSFSVDIKDLISGASGTSQVVEVLGAKATAFRLFAPKEAVAGQPFELSIIALDQYGNVAVTYGANAQGAKITSTGVGKPFPASVSAYEFVLGQAVIPIVYNKVEDIQLVVSDYSGQFKAMTDTIKVSAPVVAKYEVITPDTAVAGQRFKIKITALDSKGKPVKNYNLFGADVELSTKNGTGALEPSRVPASLFVDGSAVVEVKYNKTESFDIVATAIAPETQTPEPVKPQKPTKKSRKLSANTHSQHTSLQPTPSTDKPTKSAPKAIMRIQNISMVETAHKTNVTVHLTNITNALKYTAYTETHDGKKYIVLKLAPVTSEIETPVALDSAYVSSVNVIDASTDKANTKLIKLELKKPTRFSISKDKNALHIVLKR